MDTPCLHSKAMPGQGIVLRRHNLPFRPDWEHVVGKVLLGFALDHITTAAELADIIDTRRAWTSKGPLQV